VSIDEERVDRRLGYLRSFMQSAWRAELPEAEALLERIRVELMLNRVDAATKQFYRAAARCLEDAVARRRESAGKDEHDVGRAMADYLDLFLEGLRN
jgi:hypothetical protein